MSGLLRGNSGLSQQSAPRADATDIGGPISCVARLIVQPASEGTHDLPWIAFNVVEPVTASGKFVDCGTWQGH